MNVILFGATGMVGQGVLREAILDPEVTRIISVVRRPSGGAPVRDGLDRSKVREIVHPDMTSFASIEDQLGDLDACFFCLGVTSAGLDEAGYTKVTYDIALAAGEALARRSPQMTFVFVSGAGTDGSESGKTMWARVKGRTENALMRLPFKAVYAFRPGAIRARNGEISRTTSYRVLYALLAPLWILGDSVAPKYFTSTEKLGRAMLRVAKQGAPKKVLESADINSLGT